VKTPASPIGLLAALAAGCGGALGTPTCDGGSCGSQTSTKAVYPYSGDRRVDLLFVVDDTPAIAPYADRVAAGIADIATQLQNSALPLSLHVGFVRAGSCDPSTRARACGITAPREFVGLRPCNTVDYATGPFADALACLGALGAADCAPIHPIAAALQVLQPGNTGWDSFFRRDAYLEVIIVAASDDATAPPRGSMSVTELAGSLKNLKGDPSQVLVTVIGPGDCAAGDVRAPRLAEFVNQFGSNGLYMGLCGGALSAAVDKITLRENDALLPPCLTNVRDTDLTTPGMQASCTVVQRSIALDTETTSEQEIPSCDTGRSPCWTLMRDQCAAGPGWRLNLDAPLDQCVDGIVDVDVECLGCADPNNPACAQAP